MTCTYTFLPGGREVQEFSLDGSTEEEVGRAVLAVRKLYNDNLDDSIGLVVDVRGVSVDFDWDDCILYGVRELPDYPGVVVLRTGS